MKRYSQTVSLIRRKLRSTLGNYPRIFLPIMYLRGKRSSLAVRKSTHLVIEGYPRSANTFALAAFTVAQSKTYRIAHHLHVPAQIIQAARWNIPTFILIRKPVDAVISCAIRSSEIPVRQLIEDYNHFYNRIWPYREMYVTAPFELVINDFGKVIQQVNKRFGTDFEMFEHTEENINTCFKLIDQMDMEDQGSKSITTSTVARPSRERDNLKASIANTLETEFYNQILTTANQLYFDFISHAQEQSKW